MVHNLERLFDTMEEKFSRPNCEIPWHLQFSSVKPMIKNFTKSAQWLLKTADHLIFCAVTIIYLSSCIQ